MKIQNALGPFFIFSFLAFFFMAADTPTPVQVPVNPPPADSILKQAQRYEETGQYAEAQKIYEKLSKDPEIRESKPLRRKIQKARENLNLKWLFSRFEMPGSRFYTVKEGDSLYKIAKENKTTVEFLKKSNGLKNDVILPGMKLKVLTGTFSIHVNKSKNRLKLFLDHKLIKHYRIATGQNNSTPSGEFHIVNKIVNPTWYKAGAVIPPGSPNNWLGSRWLGFDYPGYGIHGTIDPKSIGKQSSSGCIRMFNEDVEELYTLIPAGVKVTVTD